MTNADFAERPSVNSPGVVDANAYPVYIDWGSILAGAVVTAAIFSMLTTFGAAVGLSVVSPFSGEGLSATAMGAATAIWVLWIAVSSFVVGGYLVGRMRRRTNDSSEHESNIRDGVHGLVVWAMGALLIGWMATSSITGLAKGAAGETVGNAGQKLLQSSDPIAYLADRLWRSTAPNGPATDVGKREAANILANSALTGAMNSDDKAYLTAEIVSRSGLAPADAAKRVEETMKQIVVNADKAKVAAEKARKIGILVAFLTAASLAISAAAAWWAASKGGQHRDEGLDIAHLTAWR